MLNNQSLRYEYTKKQRKQAGTKHKQQTNKTAWKKPEKVYMMDLFIVNP